MELGVRVWVTVSSRLPLPLVMGLSMREQLPAQGEAALLAAVAVQRKAVVLVFAPAPRTWK